MNEPRKSKSDVAGNSIAGAIGGVVSAALIALFVAIWTGTVSGPANPAFWQQLAPFVICLLVVVFLVVKPIRMFFFSILRLLKKPVVWLLGLRITDTGRRNSLVEKGKEEALTEVAKRNAKPAAFNIVYLQNSPVDGIDLFSLTDFSSISGDGPMKDIHISAPREQIKMEDKDGPTIPTDDADDPYQFSGIVTDDGRLGGINFRVSSRDRDGYPRVDFYHVRPIGPPLKGVQTGSFGDVTYGELVTSRNMYDASLTIKWVSTQQVMGQLTPSGRGWKVEFGHREGRLDPHFVVEDELGVASTAAEGVELLRFRALQEEEVQEADGTAR